MRRQDGHVRPTPASGMSNRYKVYTYPTHVHCIQHIKYIPFLHMYIAYKGMRVVACNDYVIIQL